MSFAAVLTALVASCEILVPGCGSKVSNWLGPPLIHRMITDFAGLPLGSSSAAPARRSGRGVNQTMPDRPIAAWTNDRRQKCAAEPQLANEFVFVWSLVIGSWSLVLGHWFLVIGSWSLVIPRSGLVIP